MVIYNEMSSLQNKQLHHQ